MKAKHRLLVIFLCVAAYSFVTVEATSQSIIEKILNVLSPNPKLPNVPPKVPIVPINPLRPKIPLKVGVGRLPFNDSVNMNNQETEAKKNNLPSNIPKRALPTPNIDKIIENNRKILNVLTEKAKNRFINYAKISSQSVDTADMNAFPMTEGQINMAEYLENELRGICKGSNAVITRSSDQYVYVKIPSNMKGKSVPSLMFMAHLDVTPEAPGQNIKPIVHENYDGGEIKLPAGIVLSPETPQGAYLKNCKGRTIITSDGSTLLGADDKAGVTILWDWRSSW